jgi:dipeptidyl aminopeptidase/acylaminoacyl peptidase
MIRRLLASAAVLSLCATGPVLAQSAPLTAEAMWNLTRVGQPSLSPDGKTAVVPVTRFDIKKNKGFTDLYLIPTDGTGAARQLTTSEASDTEPSWSPDGSMIAFISKRGEDEAGQVYVIAPAGGEARRITNVPTGASGPKWLADSRRIAFLSAVWPDLQTFDEQAKRLKERAESKMTAQVWDKAPIYWWDRWLDEREVHVWLTDIDGAAPTSPTRGSGQSVEFRTPEAGDYDVAPDGSEVAFCAETDRTGVTSNIDLYAVPLSGGQARNLTAANKADDCAPAYAPDGRTLAYTRNLIPGAPDRDRLMFIDRSTGAQREATPGWDRSADGLVWSADSQSLFGGIDDAGSRRIYRFSVQGGAPQLVTKTSDHTNLDAAGGVLVALRQSFSEPATLVKVDPATGASVQLSRFNDQALAGLAMGRVESVTYAGTNNVPIQMWVTYPPGFDPSKKYPVLLLLHGGPHVGITDAFSYRWNAQVMANWGYVVAWHNFHGSSGFGDAFADSINPDWASKPYEDTIRAANWFQRQPWADRDRMVAAGASYGGYLATVLLGREHPFKALVAHAAVYNLYTQVGADAWSDRSRFYEYWENPAAFQAISPHMRAASFKTPTLVIHGQLDYRVPVNHGIELFHTLRKRNVPTRLIYYPNENHWILQPQNSLFWYGEVRKWVEQYAPPGPR